MIQREIWMAYLNPVRGIERCGIRPVVVVSGNAMNDKLGIVIVCPITSHIKSYTGCIALQAASQNGSGA